jgi:hypothetical protein
MYKSTLNRSYVYLLYVYKRNLRLQNVLAEMGHRQLLNKIKIF